MKFILSVLLLSTTIQSYSQQNISSKNYLKASGGRMLFGTGDIVGFSVNIEASKNILKTSKPFLNKLLIGAEFSFENGVRNPMIDNPTNEDFIHNTFYHVSNSILSGKVTYYPFLKIFRGFNISVGPSIGYGYFSSERSADRFVFAPNQVVRRSQLKFDNGIFVGYRITTGYEFKVGKKSLLGFRLDFSNDNKGNINTLIAAKAGCTF